MILNRKKSPFERDFTTVTERFPKLSYHWGTKVKMWVITGELDICDTKGVYWNTFQITMLVPRSYPYCVPIVAEKSNIIPRDIEWHISPEGICCLDIDHNLKAMSKTGINLTKFISDKVYTYFANQLFKLEKDVYAGKEYAHHLDGVIQYYIETHNLRDIQTILSMLSFLMSNSTIGRNNPCPCASGKKTKYCHLSSIEILRNIGIEKLATDFKDISALL